MTLLNSIEIIVQFVILSVLVVFAVTLLLRLFNWRFPRKWQYWPLYLLNDIADWLPDRMEKIFEKIQSIRVRYW